MTNVPFGLLMSQALVPIYFQDRKNTFSSKMTLNNCKIIAETGSSRFRRRRRRVCLSSLLSVWKDRGALTEGKKVVSNDESNA